MFDKQQANFVSGLASSRTRAKEGGRGRPEQAIPDKPDERRGRPWQVREETFGGRPLLRGLSVAQQLHVVSCSEQGPNLPPTPLNVDSGNVQSEVRRAAGESEGRARGRLKRTELIAHSALRRNGEPARLVADVEILDRPERVAVEAQNPALRRRRSARGPSAGAVKPTLSICCM